MVSIRCEKCNHLMILQRSSDSDFVLHSSRYHYKCTKKYCSNYCVRIFDHKITMFHELNKKLIGMKEHVLQTKENDAANVHNSNLVYTLAQSHNAETTQLTQYCKEDLKRTERLIKIMEENKDLQSRVIMRGGQIPGTEFPSKVERVKITIEYDINSMVRIFNNDIVHAIREMYEQIDIVEDVNVPDAMKTQISSIDCEVWSRII